MIKSFLNVWILLTSWLLVFDQCLLLSRLFVLLYDGRIFIYRHKCRDWWIKIRRVAWFSVSGIVVRSNNRAVARGPWFKSMPRYELKTKCQHSLLIFRLSNFSKNVKEPFIGSFIFKIYPPPAQISEYRPKSAYRTFCVGFLVSVVPCLCVVQIAVIGQNKQNLNHNAWKQKISRHNSPNCSGTMSWDMTKWAWRDSNPRPSVPETDALIRWATDPSHLSVASTL